MNVSICRNIDLKTNEDLYGVVLQVEKGKYWCKYLAQYQDFKSESEAKTKALEIETALKNGYEVQYVIGGSKGVNRHEYIVLYNKEKKHYIGLKD